MNTPLLGNQANQTNPNQTNSNHPPIDKEHSITQTEPDAQSIQALDTQIVIPDPHTENEAKHVKTTHQHNTAVRLVDTKQLTHTEWLEVRQQGIGSSDAAAAAGVHPYKSQLALWLEKTGRTPIQEQDTSVPEERSPMYWGTVLEPIVATHYSKRTGNKVRRVHAVLQHPELPWMLANIDREVVAQADVQILECKTAGLHTAKDWADGVPYYIQLQVLHQLAVTGKQAADVAVLLSGQEFKVFRIERDEERIQRLIALEQYFWGFVERDTPPPSDGTASSEEALKQLYPQDVAAVVDCSSDDAYNSVFEELLEVRERVKALKQQEDCLSQRIKSKMGKASKAVFTAGQITWKRSKDSTTLDTHKLLKEQPQLLQQYPKIRSGSRWFVVKEV